MSDHAIGCEEALRLLAAYLDGELADAEHGDIERHVSTCRSCFSRMEFEKRLKTQLAELGHNEPDDRFAQRIRELLREFTQS